MKFLFGAFTVDFLVTTGNHFHIVRPGWDDWSGIAISFTGFLFFALLVFFQHFEIKPVQSKEIK